MKYILNICKKFCFAAWKALWGGPINKQIVKKKAKSVLQKTSYVPSLISIDASLAMKESHMLLVAELGLLWAALADKYYCCQSTCDANHRGAPCQCRPSVAPLFLSLLWFMLDSSTAEFPCGCCACFDSHLSIRSLPNCQQWEGITIQPLVFQVFLMGIYPDTFINISIS